MIKVLMANSVDLLLVILSLVLFVLLFSGIVLSTYRKGCKERYKNLANLPLQPEENT